jgi:hypothetical protein
MASKSWRNLIRTAAALCFVAGSGAQAGGVFYASDFDPLGFAGTAKWYVDDQCDLAGKSNNYYAVNALNAGCKVALYSLTIQLWENTNGGPFTTVELALGNKTDSKLIELTFASEMTPDYAYANPSPYHVPFLPDPHLVLGISVYDHKLAGLDTLLIEPACGDNGSQYNGCFGVQFTSGLLSSLAVLPFPALGNLGEKGAYLWKESPPFWDPRCHMSQFFYCAAEVETFVNGVGHAEFGPGDNGTGFSYLGRSPQGDTIPEPGSLALLGGALVAGWLTRRRKAAT